MVEREKLKTEILQRIDSGSPCPPDLKDRILEYQRGYLPKIENLPGLPTHFFKTHRISAGADIPSKHVFRTSGTTGTESGQHFFETLELYEASLRRSFELHFQRRFVKFLSWIPSRKELPHSSLAHMIDVLAKAFSDHPLQVLFSEGRIDPKPTLDALEKASKSKKPYFLCTTTIALSDLLDELETRNQRFRLPLGSTLFQTGGSKGRRSVPSTPDLVTRTETLLGIPKENHHAEYGMTELSSPSWGVYENDTFLFTAPPYAEIKILDPETEKEVSNGEEGWIHVFDPANLDSASSLLVGDWGRRHDDRFEVLGRVSEQDLRGCSLLVQENLRTGSASKENLRQIQEAKTRILETPKTRFEQRANALSELTTRALDRKAKLRQDLVEEIQRSDFFSPGSIHRGLDFTFFECTAEKLKALPPHTASRNRFGVQVSSGNLPITGVFPFYLASVFGVPFLHRPSATTRRILDRLHRELREIDPDVATLSQIVPTDSSSLEETRELFKGASWIMAQGHSDTLTTLRKAAPPSARFLDYGSAISFGFLDVKEDWTSMCEPFVEDIFVWEQQGCLSPQFLLLENAAPGQEKDVVQALQAAAEKKAREWSRTPSRRQKAQHTWLASETQAQGHGKVYLGEHLTLEVTHQVIESHISIPGWLQVLPIDPKEFHPPTIPLSSLALPFPQRYSSPFGELGSGNSTPSTNVSVNRTCAFGELQCPPLTWKQDGHDLIAELTS